MENDPALEHALLEHLRFAPLSRAELGRRTGASDGRVQAAQVVRPPQPPGTPLEKLRLSDDDRSVCTTALADQFAAGRIDQAELDRRTDLLYAARIRSDLDPVFEGLPLPTLAAPYQPPPGTQPPNWATILWIALPVVVVSAIILGHALTSGASAVTVLLFLLLVGAKIAWTYRGRRFRE